MSVIVNRFFLFKIINRLANSVDPDETAHNEPPHLDLHCLHRHLYPSTALKGLEKMKTVNCVFESFMESNVTCNIAHASYHMLKRRYIFKLFKKSTLISKDHKK